MTRRYARSDEAKRATELRAEATREGPAYSQALHARIMRVVGSAGPAHEQRSGRPMWWAWVPVAAAAAIAVVVWIGWPRSNVGPALPLQVVERRERPAMPPIDEIRRTAASAYARLEAKLDEGKLAYLDDDAKRLASFVLDNTRVLPVRR